MKNAPARGLPGARRALIIEIVEDVQRIVQGLDRFSRASLRRFGVTGPQLWALRTLARSGEMTAGRLTEEMFLHPSTVSGILDRLEERGLIVRRRGEPDRRQVLVRVTPRGTGALQRAPEPPRGRLANGLRRLPVRGLRRVRDALSLLTKLMSLDDLDMTRPGHGPATGV